jgi:RNA polymerase sigma-70 factor (ECF subfamily)
VVAYSDGGGRARAARKPIAGAAKVARFFGAIYAKPATLVTGFTELNGEPALVVTLPAGRHTVSIATDGTTITGLYVVANPDKLGALDPQTTPA